MKRIFTSLKSFTLIELVIVLALLAILSAMAVSKFVDIAKKAYDTTENSTIDSLRTGALLFKARYNTWPNINLFTLLENPPPNLEAACFGCIRDGKTWRTYNGIPGVCAASIWIIECPHLNPQSGGVMRGWRYFGPGADQICCSLSSRRNMHSWQYLRNAAGCRGPSYIKKGSNYANL